MAAAHLAAASSSLVASSRATSGLPSLRIASVPRTRAAQTERSLVAVRALLSEDKASTEKKRKFITREEEPQEYWKTQAEREGKGPMSTLLPYVAILGLLTPFAILALGFANGWIKTP